MSRKGITTVAYEDTSFVSGDSPITLDINTDIGADSVGGYIICDGAGNIQVEFSTDGGVTWGGQHTIKNGEKVELTEMDIDCIKITHITDSSYRVLAF